MVLNQNIEMDDNTKKKYTVAILCEWIYIFIPNVQLTGTNAMLHISQSNYETMICQTLFASICSYKWVFNGFHFFLIHALNNGLSNFRLDCSDCGRSGEWYCNNFTYCPSFIWNRGCSFDLCYFISGCLLFCA